MVALKVLVARFKIFLSTMFYIGHGWGQRNSVHLTRAYKGGKVGGNPKKVGTPSSNASNNTQKVDKIEAVKRRGGIIEVHKFAQGVSKDQARYLLAHCFAIFLCYVGGKKAFRAEKIAQLVFPVCRTFHRDSHPNISNNKSIEC